MVGIRRVPGSARAFFARSRAPFWALVSGCAIASCSAGSGGSGSPISVGEVAGVGNVNLGVAGSDPGPSCQPSMTQTPVFVNEMFAGPLTAPFDFYVWTTAAEGTALRTSKQLFAGGPNTTAGAALSQLDSLTIGDASGLAFETSLRIEFQAGRVGWPEPWATRLLQPDGVAELVRVTLRPEAWLAVIQSGTSVVYDSTGARVALTDAYAHPERVGAIYFDDSAAGCGSSIGATQREFLLGNEAMVQQWSLGTPENLQRLQKDIQDLSDFLNKTRSCPISQDESSWSRLVPCEWSEIASVTPLPFGAGSPATGGAAGDLDIGIGGEGGAGSDFAGAPGNSAGGVGGALTSGTSGGGAASFAGTPGAAGAGSRVGGRFDFSSVKAPNGTENFAYESVLASPISNYYPQPPQVGAIISALQGDLFEPDPLIVTPGSP